MVALLVLIEEEVKTSKVMMEAKNLKIFSEPFVIIRCTQQENSGVSHKIRNFVGVHRKGLQSVCQHTAVNFSTYFR